MNWLELLSNPTLVNLSLLVVSIAWMLRDETDRIRPLVVMGIVLNCSYGWLLGTVLTKEDSLVAWKYDYYLHNIDGSLGFSAGSVALAFHGPRLIVLQLIYQMMVPMMIFWCVLTSRQKDRSVPLAYLAEMVIGPLLYALLPAIGPAYAFGANWIHPPIVQATLVKLSGMPNAFPSLHVATSMVFVLSARNRILRSLSMAFLFGTALATLATGEHYLIDLVVGAAFGCFASNVSYRNWRRAIFYLAVVVCWELTIRFFCQALFVHPAALGLFVASTLSVAAHEVWKRWRSFSDVVPQRTICIDGNIMGDVTVSL